MTIKFQREILDAIKSLANKELEPKSWSKSDQNKIIEYLRYEEGWSQAKIGQLLNLVTDTVRARIRKIDEGYRNTLISRGYDAWSIVAEAKRKKEIVQQKAGQQGNWSLVWKAEIDFIALLMKLGLIKEAELGQEEIEIAKEYKNMSKIELRELYEESKLEAEIDSQAIEEEQ